MRLSLVSSDNKVLRTRAKTVKNPGQVADLANDLFETMAAEGGVGLAAPQVGKSVRLFVVGVRDNRLAIINPEITERSEKEIWWEEGCLSLPRLLGDVKRSEKVTVRFTTPEGESAQLAADNLMARVIQHEIDHLDGVLFPDRMGDLSKLRKISEEEWQSRFETAAKAPE